MKRSLANSSSHQFLLPMNDVKHISNDVINDDLHFMDHLERMTPYRNRFRGT